jgi:hypothetical protein
METMLKRVSITTASLASLGVAVMPAEEDVLRVLGIER